MACWSTVPPCPLQRCNQVKTDCKTFAHFGGGGGSPPYKSIQKSQYQYQSIRGTLADEALSNSTIYPTPWTPSSLAWVQPMKACLWPHSPCRLVVGTPALGHHKHTVCSLACHWQLGLALGAHRESFSIESGPMLDSNALPFKLQRKVVLE